MNNKRKEIRIKTTMPPPMSDTQAVVDWLNIIRKDLAAQSLGPMPEPYTVYIKHDARRVITQREADPIRFLIKQLGWAERDSAFTKVQPVNGTADMGAQIEITIKSDGYNYFPFFDMDAALRRAWLGVAA